MTAHTPPLTAADLMRLIDRYAAHLAVAEWDDAVGAHASRDREQGRAAPLRDRIRSEVDRLYAQDVA